MTSKSNLGVNIESQPVSDETLKKANISEGDLKKGLSGEQVESIKAVTLSEYYVSWLDNSIPALNGMTPKEASKTEDGRALIEKLITYMQKMPTPESLKPDFNAIRSALGMK